jgi:GAF domain-containing protein
VTPIFDLNEELSRQVIDPSDLQGSMRALDRVVDRISLLMDAARAINSTLQVNKAFFALSRIIVPSMADGCIIYLVIDGREMRAEAAFHVDPKLNQKLQAFAQEPASLDEVIGPAFIIRSGKAELVSSFDMIRFGRMISADPNIMSPKSYALVRELSATSYMGVPIAGQNGSTVGVISFLNSSPSHRHFNEDDLSLANEVALLVGQAMRNAWEYKNASSDADRLRIEHEAKYAFFNRQVHDLKTLLTTVLLTQELISRNANYPDKVQALNGKARDALLKARAILIYDEEELKRLPETLRRRAS